MAKIKQNGPPSVYLKNLGPIKNAQVEFGDLTFIVGPQASGKSIFLQLFKLITDKKNFADTIELYGYSIDRDPHKTMELFFGEGMGHIWTSESEVLLNKKKVQLKDLVPKQGEKSKEESIFYIPAQRVITVQDGWPRPFSSYVYSDPYVIKDFSETLRRLMEKGSGISKSSKDIFPQLGRMKSSLRNVIISSIFNKSKIVLDDTSMKKRFLQEVNNSRLPFMTWSAGQKEFMPLLLGLYWLTPPSKVAKKEHIEWVIIEEPEMGLHPQAIQALVLLFLELVHRGYKVIVSTHSPVLLELAWVINSLKGAGAPSKLLFELFNVPHSAELGKVFDSIISPSKTVLTYYFHRGVDGVEVKNISNLDPSSPDDAEAEWGGLSAFSGRASEVVSKAISTL